MISEEKPNLPIQKTKASILVHLLSEDLSALDLEDQLGINESAIRRHLDNLEMKNYVEHHFEKASRGRPKKLYSLTERGEKIFPQKTHLLFSFLAKSIEEEYGEKKLQKILSSAASKLANRLTPEITSDSKEERLKDLVESLDEFGFYPKFTEKDGNYYVSYRNCVFGGATEEFRGELCEMHRQIIQNAIPGCEIEQEKSRKEGDNLCTHRLSFEDG